MEANTASDADLLHSLDRFWSLLAKTSNMTINFNEYQHFYLSLVKTLDLGLGADSDYTPFDCARMDWTKQLSIQYDQHLEANESFGLEMTQRSFNRSLFEVVYQSVPVREPAAYTAFLDLLFEQCTHTDTSSYDGHMHAQREKAMETLAPKLKPATKKAAAMYRAVESLGQGLYQRKAEHRATARDGSRNYKCWSGSKKTKGSDTIGSCDDENDIATGIQHRGSAHLAYTGTVQKTVRERQAPPVSVTIFNRSIRLSSQRASTRNRILNHTNTSTRTGPHMNGNSEDINQSKNNDSNNDNDNHNSHAWSDDDTRVMTSEGSNAIASKGDPTTPRPRNHHSHGHEHTRPFMLQGQRAQVHPTPLSPRLHMALGREQAALYRRNKTQKERTAGPGTIKAGWGALRGKRRKGDRHRYQHSTVRAGVGGSDTPRGFFNVHSQAYTHAYQEPHPSASSTANVNRVSYHTHFMHLKGNQEEQLHWQSTLHDDSCMDQLQLLPPALKHEMACNTHAHTHAHASTHTRTRTVTPASLQGGGEDCDIENGSGNEGTPYESSHPSYPGDELTTSTRECGDARSELGGDSHIDLRHTHTQLADDSKYPSEDANGHGLFLSKFSLFPSSIPWRCEGRGKGGGFYQNTPQPTPPSPSSSSLSSASASASAASSASSAPATGKRGRGNGRGRGRGGSSSLIVRARPSSASIRRKKRLPLSRSSKNRVGKRASKRPASARVHRNQSRNQQRNQIQHGSGGRSRNSLSPRPPAPSSSTPAASARDPSSSSTQSASVRPQAARPQSSRKARPHPHSHTAHSHTQARTQTQRPSSARCRPPPHNQHGHQLNHHQQQHIETYHIRSEDHHRNDEQRQGITPSPPPPSSVSFADTVPMARRRRPWSAQPRKRRDAPVPETHYTHNQSNDSKANNEANQTQTPGHRKNVHRSSSSPSPSSSSSSLSSPSSLLGATPEPLPLSPLPSLSSPMSKVENLSLHPSPWTDEGRGEGGGAYRQAIGANAAAGKTEEDEEGGKDTDSGVELKKLTAPVIEERDEERGRNELRAKHMGAAMERERKREREEAREKEEAYQVSTDDSALRLAMDSMHFRRGKPLQKVQEADNELELELQRERELTMDLGAKNRTESGEVETTAVVAAKSRGRSGEAGKESVPLIREISDENGDGSGDGIGGELQGNNKHAEARPPLDRNPVHRNQSPDGPGVEAVSVTSSPIFASLQARAETVLASAASVLQPSSSSIFPSSPSARVPATESSHRLHQQHRLSPAVQDLFSFTASTSPITSIIATAAAAKRVAGVSGRSGGGSESSSIKNRVDLDASKRAGRQKVVRKSTFVGTSIQRRARAKVRRSSRVKGRKNNHANTNTNRTAKRKQSKGKGKGHKKDQGKRRGKKRLSLVTSFNAEQSRIDSNPAESSGVSQAHPQSYTAPHSLGFQALPDGSVDLNTHLDPKLNSMPRFIAPAPASAFASAWDSRDHTGAGTSMATSQPLHHQQQQQQQLHRYHPVYGQQQQHSEASRVSASPSPQAYQSQFASIVSDALRSRSYSGVGVGSHEYHLRQMHQYYASMAATEQPRKQEVLQRAIAQLPQDLRRLHQQHQQHQPHRYNADAGSSSSDFSRPYANDMHSNINARGGGDDDDGGGSSGVGVSAGEDGGNMDGTMSERRTTAGKAAEVKVTELDHTYVPFWEKMGKQREEEREGDLEVAGPTSSALVPVPEPVPDSASALASTSKSSVRSLSHIFRPSSARHWTNTATATELAATSTAHHYHHLHHQQLQYHQRYVGDAPVQVMTPFQHREGDQN